MLFYRHVEARVDTSYAAFRRILEDHYLAEPVKPTEGCLECFGWLHDRGIKIALTTGFYRRVTDIIQRYEGEIEFWAAGVRPGTVMYEIGGVPEGFAQQALIRVAHKLPVRCRFVKRGIR